jgi:hypothetical protein
MTFLRVWIAEEAPGDFLQTDAQECWTRRTECEACYV